MANMFKGPPKPTSPWGLQNMQMGDLAPAAGVAPGALPQVPQLQMPQMQVPMMQPQQQQMNPNALLLQLLQSFKS